MNALPCWVYFCRKNIFVENMRIRKKKNLEEGTKMEYYSCNYRGFEK